MAGMNGADTVGRRKRRVAVTGVLLLACFGACDGPQEAPRLRVPLVVDASAITPCTTNLGYAVTLSRAQMVIDDVEFATAGEAHTAHWLDRVGDWPVAKAYAHPGHYQGGEVTGALSGHFLVDWTGADGSVLGTADLLVGAYDSANFTFSRATASDTASAEDPLIGYTALLLGTVIKADFVAELVVLVDSPVGRELVGVPFVERLSAGDRVALGFQLMTIDPLEKDTLFDDIDFAALATRTGEIQLTAAATDTAEVDAYNSLLRTFQTHDHFRIEPVTLPGGNDE